MQFYTVFLVIGVAVVATAGSDVQELPISTIENVNQYLSSQVDDSNYLATDGYDVFSGQFPYHARIFIKHGNETGHTLSSGSLITPNYILTSANGLQSNNTHGYVVLGVDDSSSAATQQQINFTESGIQIHPMHNIATVRLEHPVTYTRFVQPIRLPRLFDSRTYETMEGTNVGSYSGPLKYLRNQVISNDVCHEEHPHAYIYSYNICTNTYVGGAFCNRAYGSGLIVEGEKGPILIGITTAVYVCAVNYPNVYLRVSDFRDWIGMNSNYVFDF
uniref:Peptidase S1 domain-containing protein n=1 Tax=Anopheles funestus TaxID=62324 RepID=A0A182RMJ4_ANOFN